MYYPPSIQPTKPPPALDHLTPDDQTAFLKYSFGLNRAIPFPVVHHAFEHHVQQQPTAICVEHESYGHRMSYKQVDRLANRLARRIRVHIVGQTGSGSQSQGSRRELRICILARRSVYLIIAILAILKSGGQYVPIDAVTVTDPALQHIINDSDPAMVLIMEEFSEKLDQVINKGAVQDDTGIRVPQIRIERAIEEDERLNADDSKPYDPTTPEDGCYIIYTSGTTGVPKGVDVRHIGVSNVICAPPGNVYMKPGMRVAQLLNIAFDMGAWEILSSLYNGCTLCIRGNTYKEWVHLLKSVDVVISTPSILARHNPADYPNIKHVIVGGEACPQSLADNWAMHTQFNNCCGPTEISVCNTIQPHTPGYPLSIGTPIPNTSVYILSQDYDYGPSHTGYPPSPAAVPIGETGSMWVGGIGVSKGYLNLPSKTAERWLPDPFRERQDEDDGKIYLMFNTNDLGRWREDGQLEHCGRADDQVKVRGGFRVELDGVASAMMRAAFVRAAVALLVDGVLWGFVMRREDRRQRCRAEQMEDVADDDEEEERRIDLEQEIEQVRRCTKEVMSYYAVPEKWMIMDEFPMTRNGKVDKRALVALTVEREPEKEADDVEIKEKEGIARNDGTKGRCGANSSTASTPTTPTTERNDTDTETDILIPPLTSARNRQYPSHHAHPNQHHVSHAPWDFSNQHFGRHIDENDNNSNDDDLYPSGSLCSIIKLTKTPLLLN